VEEQIAVVEGCTCLLGCSMLKVARDGWVSSEIFKDMYGDMDVCVDCQGQYGLLQVNGGGTDILRGQLRAAAA
jgi:hypothetical protein